MIRPQKRFEKRVVILKASPSRIGHLAALRVGWSHAVILPPIRGETSTIFERKKDADPEAKTSREPSKSDTLGSLLRSLTACGTFE